VVLRRLSFGGGRIWGVLVVKAEKFGDGSNSWIPTRQLGSNASSSDRSAAMSRGAKARTIPVMVKRFSSSGLPGRVKTAWLAERAVMSRFIRASSSQSFSSTPGVSRPCKETTPTIVRTHLAISRYISYVYVYIYIYVIARRVESLWREDAGPK